MRPHVLAPKFISQNYFDVVASGCVNTATASIQWEGRAKVRKHTCEGANTYFKNNSSKHISCTCASANTGPTCIRAKINPQEAFPACSGFVPGGTAGHFFEVICALRLAIQEMFEKGLPCPHGPRRIWRDKSWKRAMSWVLFKGFCLCVQLCSVILPPESLCPDIFSSGNDRCKRPIISQN